MRVLSRLVGPCAGSDNDDYDRQDSFAKEVGQLLRQEGMRVEEDLRNEKIGFKIREARQQKIPYMIIMGDKEMQDRTLAVRKRGEESTNTFSRKIS